jgi:hypothetical protein
MTSRERVAAAMRPLNGIVPDRVPVMCQLALGHYFLQTPSDPVDIWHDSRVFGDALAMLQKRYGFDGILVNLPGRDPEWRRHIAELERTESETRVRWSEGPVTIVPRDDNPRVVDRRLRRLPRPTLDDLDPESLFYVEPHDRLGVTPLGDIPPWQYRTLEYVRTIAPDVSVHGEVFSPFSQLVELLGCAESMLALVDDPDKVARCLRQLTRGAVAIARGLVAAGADAVLISSAYAGAGFISRPHYDEFVLPFERDIVSEVKTLGAIVYTHTCGAIGDRLDLMQRSGTCGIDTLDPPPLGTVDLAGARQQLAPSVFIKGNIDPVNTVLRGKPDDCRRAARERIAQVGRDGGYILSTACSVPPHAPAHNILQLAEAAREAACAA